MGSRISDCLKKIPNPHSQIRNRLVHSYDRIHTGRHFFRIDLILLDELDVEAETSAATVRMNIQRASNYVLTVVLYAVVLFFAGVSTRLRSTSTA